MEYYLIKHVASGEYMPQMKRGRGYSHWNPSKQSKMSVRTNVPRLLTSEAQAKRVITAWSVYPNASTIRFESGFEQCDDFLTKPDGRKKEDLTVVKMRMEEVAILPPMNTDEILMVTNGRKITAVRMYRERTGHGLKDAVDAMRALVSL
jgi:ribosomal protein S19